MKRSFRWIPTPVWSSQYMRAGFKWLAFAWKGDDGRYYTKRTDGSLEGNA